MSTELDTITKILQDRGFTLDSHQPHISGERFLMQALTTVAGQKFILLGHASTGEKVVIKITQDEAGKREINHERICRGLINSLDFAYDVFAVPTEIFHHAVGDYLINVQLFIPQTISFLERPLLEQFDFSLRALTAQENSRATTGSHLVLIKKTFGLMEAKDYLTTFNSFIQANTADTAVLSLLKQTYQTLTTKALRITQYGNFLTHSDFVPHNFRIKDNLLYLLDFSAIRFGNKHESWARFLNFMTLHHPALEQALLTYFQENRSAEENESLHLMRLFRLGEIISYYRHTLKNSTGNLHHLNTARITFWSAVLAAELQNSPVPDTVRLAYQTTRDELRSDDEKQRQIGLH